MTGIRLKNLFGCVKRYDTQYTTETLFLLMSFDSTVQAGYAIENYRLHHSK